MQDTAFASVIPTSGGLLLFNSLDEAVEELRRVEAELREIIRSASLPQFNSRGIRNSDSAR